MLGRWGTLLLGALLLAQGVGKLASPTGYLQSLAKFRMVPDTSVALVAIAWIVVELAAGGGLLAAGSITTSRAVGIAAATLALFDALGYIVLTFGAKLRGIWVPNCTCFGIFLPQPLSLSVLLQDVAMLGWTSWQLLHFVWA